MKNGHGKVMQGSTALPACPGQGKVEVGQVIPEIYLPEGQVIFFR